MEEGVVKEQRESWRINLTSPKEPWIMSCIAVLNSVIDYALHRTL
jgi:hypothetical protein